MMGKVLIHYFSGTGNSLFAAKYLGNELKKHGSEVVLQAIEDGLRRVDNEFFSLHVFIFPIYATSVPHIMLKYLRKLPQGDNVQAVIISTNGRLSTLIRDGYQGWALHQARLLLHLKGYDVYFSDTLDFPHNVTAFMPPRKKEINRVIIEKASVRIPDIAQKIIKRERYHRRFFIPNIIWSLPFGFLYTYAGRRFFGKLFAADRSCVSCGYCVEKCPVKAIEIKSGKIKWHWNCEGCLRCFNSCPQKAIQISAIRIITVVCTTIIIPIWLIIKLLAFGPVADSLVFIVCSVLLSIIIGMILMVIVDWIIDRLSCKPIFKGFLTWGHTKLYGRYRVK